MLLIADTLTQASSLEATLAVPTLGAVVDVIRGAVMVLFVISAVLVTLVVLAQEGKGGGLAGAFGGAGADTFGVKAGTVNKFTAWLAAAFLGLALLYAGLGSFVTTTTEEPDTTPYEQPDDIVAPGNGAPGGDSVVPPAGNGAGKGGGPGKGGGNGQGGGKGDGKGGGKNEKPANAEEDKAPEDKAPEDKPADGDK